MGISLVMFTEKGERRTFPLENDKAVIGRTSQADIQIPLEEISRRHTELEIAGDRLIIRDLGSSNGTYANNRRVQEAQLRAGETLTVGPVVFTVLVDGKPTAIKPIRTVLKAGVSAKKKSKKKERAFVEPSLDDDGPDVDLDKIDLNDSAILEELALKKNWKDPLKEIEALQRQRQKAGHA
jgi:pSer/pThr/pTyr-binding forkhead associated (FHA) protein